MKFAYGYFFILLLTGVHSFCFASQADTTLQQDTSDLIIYTLFPKADPFQSSELIRIDLEFNMRKFLREKYEDKYHPALLRYTRIDDSVVEKSIRIQARGEFRRKHCNFPPIKLSFKKTEFEEEYMNDITSLKLVTHCKASEVYQQYILKEYLVYRMFNILTDNSYRVRLFEVEYKDSENRMKSELKYGFLIESHGHLAKRLDVKRLERRGIPAWMTDPYQANLMAFFQYMIGNPDWAVASLHNIRLYQSGDDEVPNPISIPYDFDYCGMVNAYYAIPDERLEIESVKERVYKGFCLESDKDYEEYARIFIEHKTALFSVIENFELLDKKHKKEMLKYLDEFFGIIEHPQSLQNEIIQSCTIVPGSKNDPMMIQH